MAATWAFTAPSAAAEKEVHAAGLTCRVSPGAAYATVSGFGRKRAVLAKVTATGTYSTGGDAINPALVGLAEIHAAFIVASATSTVRPNVDASATSGTPTVLAVAGSTPKIQYFDVNTEMAAGGTITNDVFHVILVGV